jgi:hypothetical protein
MDASSPRHPLKADKPKVIVLGDGIVDWHIYDMRSEDADQSLAWTSPLSRDDWHYAAGFDTRQCLAGAAAIHAMLWANDIAVTGNVFPIDSAFCNPPENGSILVLRKRANAGKTKEERTRAYLMKSQKKGTWQEIAASGSNAEASTDRDETWRAAVNLLCKRGVPYVGPFVSAERQYDKEAVKAVCLWDVGRGFFHAPTDAGDWEAEQDALFNWYKALCNGPRKPPILVRTSDPDRFERFLKKLAGEPGEAPIVVLVCALGQIYDGDLRGSGTWSGIWAQAYDYLNWKQKDYLFDSARKDWRFHIVIPVYEDGVIWIGPNCWPIDEADRNEKFLRKDKRPLGKLFMIPGTQPGLSEFEEHRRIIGAHALLTYAIIEHLADTPTDADLAPAIKKGLMRSRRLRSHGYCTPDELFLIENSGEKFYLNYPCEVWKRELREATDLLLDVRDPQTGQNAGPYEVECKVEFPNPTDLACRSLASLRIFHTIEKKISNEFVASPLNCNRVVGDVGQKKDVLERLELEKINDYWVKINGKPFPLDSFAKEEIESFTLRQRISMQFGNFAMADPKEAAPILDLAQRVRQHVLSNRYNSPDKGSVFNFALFGSPGSGKSFLAREIARLIDSKGAIFSPDEFNLSQFTEPAQLTRALEVIASKSVGGKVPLVLWDEFDSVIDGQRGGWLARFLMLMQDAHFFDGRQKRPIGTAVFVFIGGTFPTAEEFRAWACTTTKRDEPPSEAVLLKARDFHSRLYTALDMPSIVEKDECAGSHSEGRCQIFRTDWVNSYAKLARAVLLREFFRNNSKIGKTVFLQRVEDDLCKFLLAIPLRHGARSLQRIVEACLVSKPSRVSMLHLPPPHFLAEHIETENVRRDSSKEIGMTIDEMLEACRG